MREHYSHIFFDLDNTLWDFEKNSKNAMRIAFQNFFPGERLAFEDFFTVYSAINDHLWDEYKKRNIQKKALIHQRFKQTFDECALSGAGPEEMNTFYLEEMAKQKDLKPGALGTLQYLKNKKYTLHIITNGFREVQHRKMENSGLKPFFTNIFISEDVKVPKPGAEIFEYAIKSSNARKSESLMVGDDWSVDIVGANRFGIDSVYVPTRETGLPPHKTGVGSKNRVYIYNKISELTLLL